MTPKPKPITPVLEDSTNEAKTREWNESISPRLQSMKSWFSGDEWHKGLKFYLNSVLQKRREHLEEKNNSPVSDAFIKGQIAMLKEIMAIPTFIEQQIALAGKNKDSGPKGDAGY